jgi:outer membrane usher protein
MTPLYSDLSLASTTDKDPWNVDITGAVPIAHAGSLSVEVAREEVVNVDLSSPLLRLTRPPVPLAFPSAGPPIRVKRATLNFTWRLFSRAQVNANISRELREGIEMPYWFGYAGLSLALGSRVSLNVTGQSYNNQPSAHVDINRPRGDGPGYGYRFTGSFYGDSSDKGTAQIEGRSQRFWGGARTEQSADGTSSTTLAFAGGLAWAGGTVKLSSPIDNSFAVVRLPDSPGVQVLLDNKSAGRTDRRGTLLVPNLSPYYGNLISINSTDLPLDVNIERVSRVIAPPYRGAASVRFGITRLRAWVGTIRIVEPGGPVAPAYGTLAIGGPPALAQSPLGADGAFYIDGIKPGSYTATVTYAGGTCTFTIALSDSGKPMTQLGVLECRQEGGQ